MIYVYFVFLSNNKCANSHSESGGHWPAAIARATYKGLNYSRSSIPKINASEPVTVYLSLAIRQIHDIDEFHQVMKVSVWQREYWVDEHLQWDPEEYGGVESIQVQGSEIWTPDLVLYTNGNDAIKPMIEHPRATVDYQGNVKHLFPIMYYVACEMNMRYCASPLFYSPFLHIRYSTIKYTRNSHIKILDLMNK